MGRGGVVRARFVPTQFFLEEARRMNVHLHCLLCARGCKRVYSEEGLDVEPGEWCSRFAVRRVELVKLVEKLNYADGVGECWEWELWLGRDGKYYVTERRVDASPFYEGGHEVSYGPREIIAGPFDTPDEAEEWACT